VDFEHPVLQSPLGPKYRIHLSNWKSDVNFCPVFNGEISTQQAKAAKMESLSLTDPKAKVIITNSHKRRNEMSEETSQNHLLPGANTQVNRFPNSLRKKRFK